MPIENRIRDAGYALYHPANVSCWTTQRACEVETWKQPDARSARDFVDTRAQPRFKLCVNISVYSKTSGTLNGYTVDISETGISAILRMEVPLDELVELDFTLPSGAVTIYAVVRQRNAFRFGFQFVESNAMSEIIRSTCRKLAVDESLKPPDGH